jgi:hypothetical protein
MATTPNACDTDCVSPSDCEYGADATICSPDLHVVERLTDVRMSEFRELNRRRLVWIDGDDGHAFAPIVFVELLDGDPCNCDTGRMQVKTMARTRPVAKSPRE